MTSIEELTAKVEQLSRQQALQTDALRQIVEGRFTGELPNAAADVVALMGGQAPPAFAPVPFPSA